MQAERNYLIKKIFPAIERECRRRNVEFTPLDLRWGITEEEARNGRVVEICMEEIARTRPFFIGLVGGRYGWIPAPGETGVDLERLQKRYPWIAPYLNERKSITEMEMLYGVLDNPEPVEAHFFLRRDLSVPRAFRETDPEGRAKRAALRERIRKAADQGRCTASDYSSVKSLGRAVYSRLMEMIDRLYPLENIPGLYDLYAAEQLHKLRDLRRVYTLCYRGDFHRRLLEGKVNILCGSPGSGLSTLLANELEKELAAEEWQPVVVHTLVDENIASQEMLKRMFIHTLTKLYPEVSVNELSENNPDPVPFETILSRFPAGEYLWVIDGVEKLPDSERNLNDLLRHHNVIDRFLLTTSDSTVIDRIQGSTNLEINSFQVDDLSPRQLEAITADYLRHYSKTLTARQIAPIAQSRVFASVKMLRSFLDKLVSFGIFEDVDKFIESFVSLSSEEEFHGRMLDYLELEFGQQPIAELIRRLSVSRIGMSEEGLFRGVVRSPLEKAAIMAAISPYTGRKYRHIYLLPGIFASVARGRYAVSENEKRRLSGLILADCREGIKELERCEGLRAKFSGWALSLIKPGAPRITAVDHLYYSQLFGELLRQHKFLGNYRKIRRLTRHFGISGLPIYDRVAMQEVFRDMQTIFPRPGKMFNAWDVFVEWLMEDGDYTIAPFWEMLAKANGQEEQFKEDVNRKWLPKSVKRNLLENLQLGAVSGRKLSELWDERRPSSISQSDLFLLMEQTPFQLANPTDEEPLRLLEKSIASLDNCLPDEYVRGVYARCGAYCALRADKGEEFNRCIREMRASDLNHLYKYDADFLELFAQICCCDLEGEDGIAACREFLDGYLPTVSSGEGETLISAIIRMTLGFLECRNQGKPEILSPELIRMASLVGPENVMGTVSKAAEALYYNCRYDIAMPMFFTLLRTNITPQARLYYYYYLGQCFLEAQDVSMALKFFERGLSEAPLCNGRFLEVDPKLLRLMILAINEKYGHTEGC